MASSARAAEPVDRAFMGTSDLISVPLAAFQAAGPAHTRSYQLILSIVPVPAVETHPFGRNGDSTSRLAIAIEAKQQIEWKASSTVTRFGDSARASLLPVLRFESYGGRIEIKPRRHSLSVGWRMDFY
jgi:hypothetical protein